MPRRVSVIGLGYVGLTMAAYLAYNGIETMGVDIDERKLTMLKQGSVPFYEPGLEQILAKVQATRHLVVTHDCEQAVSKSEVSFVTVGTPGNDDGSPNTKQLRAATASIGNGLKKKADYHLAVIRSTVVPGTTAQTVKPLLESSSGKSCGKDFGLCVNPEFLSEGRAFNGMKNPDRIVIGQFDKSSGDALENFYSSLYSDRMPPVLRTSPVNAELIKHANNAFLATKVSFINSIANLCEKADADVEVVAKGIGLDARIGPLFLRAGLGWGGSCLPKDLRGLLSYARGLGTDLPVIRAAIEVNRTQPLKAVEFVKSRIGALNGKTISVLGLSFKPDTDDVRESIGIRIVQMLLRQGARVVVYDPKAMENAKTALGERVNYAKTAGECIDGADCCIITTEWENFKNLSPADFFSAMKTPIVFDGRRIYDPAQMKTGGVDFAAVGLSEP
jgi:UDPglucose 6-dehydrogenase